MYLNRQPIRIFKNWQTTKHMHTRAHACMHTHTQIELVDGMLSRIKRGTLLKQLKNKDKEKFIRRASGRQRTITYREAKKIIATDSHHKVWNPEDKRVSFSVKRRGRKTKQNTFSTQNPIASENAAQNWMWSKEFCSQTKADKINCQQYTVRNFEETSLYGWSILLCVNVDMYKNLKNTENGKNWGINIKDRFFLCLDILRDNCQKQRLSN